MKYLSRHFLDSTIYQQIPKEDYFYGFRDWLKRLQEHFYVKGEWFEGLF